jgi:hypothetical protein
VEGVYWKFSSFYGAVEGVCLSPRHGSLRRKMMKKLLFFKNGKQWYVNEICNR